MERREFKRHLTRLTLFPFLLLLLFASVLCFRILRQGQIAQGIQRTDQLVSDSNHIMRLLVDMETGFRGYLLSGNPLFLQPYDQALGSIESEIHALEVHPAGIVSLPKKVATLRTSLDEWASYAKRFIQRREADPRFKPPFSDTEGKQKMDGMRGQVESILQVEDDARNQLSSDYARAFRITI